MLTTNRFISTIYWLLWLLLDESMSKVSIVQLTTLNLPQVKHCWHGDEWLRLSSSKFFLFMFEIVEGDKLKLFVDMKLEQYPYKDNIGITLFVVKKSCP